MTPWLCCWQNQGGLPAQLGSYENNGWECVHWSTAGGLQLSCSSRAKSCASGTKIYLPLLYERCFGHRHYSKADCRLTSLQKPCLLFIISNNWKICLCNKFQIKINFAFSVNNNESLQIVFKQHFKAGLAILSSLLLFLASFYFDFTPISSMCW